MEKPLRKDFPQTAEGTTQFNEAVKLYEASQGGGNGGSPSEGPKTANPPSVYSKKFNIVAISDTISRNGGEFRMITGSDPEGETSSFAVNESYFQRVKSQLRVEGFFELSFEQRRKDVTTYVDAKKELKFHSSSGEQLVDFKPISEKAFLGMQMSLTQKITTLTSYDASYQHGLAVLLKG